MNDHFNIFGWLLDVLSHGQEIVFELLMREMSETNMVLSHKKIQYIIMTISTYLNVAYIGTRIQHSSLLIFNFLITKYKLI